MDKLKPWTPTPENVNALPEHLRDYIHALETRCDPSSETQERVITRDLNRALERENEELKDQLEYALAPTIGDPIQKLGAWLADLLDDDDFGNTDQYLQSVMNHGRILERENERLREAANWVLHVEHGVRRDGEDGPPSERERIEALSALQVALSPDRKERG